MAKKSLYSLVDSGLTQARQKGKTPIGYTVTSYQGVLSALQSIKTVYKDVEVQGLAQNVGSRRYSILSELGLGGEATEGGFIVDGDKITYQAECDLKDYMSFPIDYSLPNSATNSTRGYIAVKRPTETSYDSHLITGKTLQNTTGCSFPPALISDNVLTDMQDGIGTQLCRIGVGISLSELALKFFVRYFGDFKWTLEIIQKLASQGYLIAEVLLPIGEDQAKVLHSIVTVRHEIQSGGPFEVWLPIPLLLLEDFSSLATVKVKVGTDKVQTVGGGNVSYPLRSSKYIHTNGSISGLDAPFLEHYFKGLNENMVSFHSIDLCNKNVKKRGRIRLYFKEEAKEELVKRFGNMNNTYSVELFRGSAMNVTKVDSITNLAEYALVGSTATGEISYTPGQVNWEALGKKAPQMLPYKDDWESICSKGNVNVRMVLAIHVLETGWGRSDAWELYKNPGGLLYSRQDNNYSDSKVEYDVWRKRSKFGGVQAKIVRKGTGHGRFYEFRTHADGIAAKVYLLLNSTNYGINLGKYNTVGDFFTGLQKGVPHQRNKFKPAAYCPDADYTSSVTNSYNSIPH